MKLKLKVYFLCALMKNVASNGYICSRMQLTESSFFVCIDKKCCTYWIYTCSRKLTESSFSMCIDEKNFMYIYIYMCVCVCVCVF